MLPKGHPILREGGNDAKRAFGQLTQAGIQEKELEDLLGIAALAELVRKNLPRRAVFGITPAELRNLPARLEKIANLAERANALFRSATTLSESPTSVWERAVDPTREPTFVERPFSSTLPEDIRRYASELRRLRRDYVHRYNRKQFNPITLQETFLLDSVRQATGRPHFEEVVTLLRASFAAMGLATSRYDGRDSVHALKTRYKRFTSRHRSARPLMEGRKVALDLLINVLFFGSR